MSGHLIGCTGALDDPQLGTSHKLALLAFADSADDRTHIAFPGYEGVQRWANCSRGRAAELIKDLVALGYLQQHKRGHRGQRAEYIVFPAGCCDLHRAPALEPVVDVAALAAAAGVTIDQARILLGRSTAVQAGVPATDPAQIPQEQGSGASDPMSVTESDTPDPFRPGVQATPPNPVDNHPNGSDTPDPLAGKGPERVHGSRSNADAFTTSTTTPLPPETGGAADGWHPGKCTRHPDAPGTNCRTCETSPRTIARRAGKAKALAARQAEHERFRAAAQAAEQQRTRPEHETTVARSLAQARAALAQDKHSRKAVG
ncbi:hypothetical protein GCM10028801_06890 [Nocardioides maradonensis]